MLVSLAEIGVTFFLCCNGGMFGRVAAFDFGFCGLLRLIDFGLHHFYIQIFTCHGAGGGLFILDRWMGLRLW